MLKKIELPKIKENLDDEAEILGILLGDGSIHNKGYTIRLQVREKEFAENFDKLIKKTYGIGTSFKKYQYFCVFVHSKVLCKRLIRLTKNNKIIPEHIFYGDNEIKARFIRGFADSEGSVDILYNRRQIVITQKNLEILEGLQKLLLDIGITSNIIIKRFDSNKLVISLLSNLTKYDELIGFSIRDKKIKLNKAIVELRSITPYSSQKYWSILRYEVIRKDSLGSDSK